MMKRIGFFDLENHFAFYGAYHSNRINIAIHMMCVWPILFTALLLLYFTPSLFNLPPFELSLSGYKVVLLFNIGFLLTLIYSVFYVRFDPRAGSLAAFLCLICWVSSSFIASRLGFLLAYKVVLVVQLLCWTGQFIGHGIFEKRAPALLDNLAQAFLMAPFFVLLEALRASGYEPYPGFHARVQAKIEAEINEWQDKRQTLIS
ncbi:2-hydroxy-palmitic acid dioxygenase mpo1-like [Vitis riparia]|uniref:2-hydroxy-palmitic acid dioxygenase mpo1-like n=1 Tax=Vitis riparia TaxID=96939 RepID=UPI00155ACC2D|nr:2-hydroxy-palmitic acid dioxygenase mpo1-like [Vitis riparia]